MGLRASSGNWAICLATKLLPSVASCLFISTSPVPDEIVTTSATFPISRCIATSVGFATSAVTEVRTAFLKPVAWTSTVYWSGGIRVKTNEPASFVVWVRLKFFPEFVSVTFAPATTFPCGSVTLPCTDEVVAVWARTLQQQASKNRRPHATENRRSFLELCFFIGFLQCKLFQALIALLSQRTDWFEEVMPWSGETNSFPNYSDDS